MEEENKDIFRNTIGTIDAKGKRKFVFPKKPVGKFYNYRTYVSWFLLAFMFAAPFVKINGNQFLLFNVLERKFHIFGFPFWPQDFHLLVISILVSVVFIILFTVVFGRIFCGWICPQTIFMEMIFRRIEYAIEGDRSKQIKLEKQPWNIEKIKKRLLKWTSFFMVSFLIANVFFAYIIGSDVLIAHIIDGPLNHLSTLIKLLVFTLVFGIGTWMAGMAGVISAPLFSVNAGFGYHWSLDAFVVVIVGGLGNVLGAFIFAMIFGELRTYGVLFFPKLVPVLMFLLMAVVLYFKPMGLFGKRG